jgi:molybdopterin-guanine dinucleotide biosynthesis protein A
MFYKEVPAVILSGGQSRRMDRKDKALLHIEEKTLLDISIDRLSSQAHRVAINTNSNHNEYTTYGLPVLKDEIKGFLGPLAGVFTAMKWADSLGYKNVATVAVDTPFFPENLLAELCKKMEESSSDIVFASSASLREKKKVIHPVFGLWKTHLLKDLKVEIEKGVRKVTLWSSKHKTSSVHFFHDIFDPFFNVNTPDDISLLKRRLASI